MLIFCLDVLSLVTIVWGTLEVYGVHISRFSAIHDYQRAKNRNQQAEPPYKVHAMAEVRWRFIIFCSSIDLVLVADLFARAALKNRVCDVIGWILIVIFWIVRWELRRRMAFLLEKSDEYWIELQQQEEQRYMAEYERIKLEVVASGRKMPGNPETYARNRMQKKIGGL